MNFITRLPGPLLVFFGATSLSFGGMIVKSFEGATLWQILFWRSLFFILVVSIFLIFTYKKDVFHAFKKSGFAGLIGGIVLSSRGQNYTANKPSETRFLKSMKNIFFISKD